MKLFYPLMAFLMALVTPSNIFGQQKTAQSISLQPIAIKLLRSDDNLSANVKKSWNRACKVIGKNLTSESGPWGHGVFETFTCFIDNKAVSGKTSINSFNWILEISDYRNEVTLTILHVPKGSSTGQVKAESKVTLPSSERTLEALRNRDVAALIALELMDSLPMSRHIKLTSTTKSLKYRDRLKRGRDLPPAPEEYTIFSLDYSPEKDRWIPDVVGTAKRDTKQDTPLRDPDSSYLKIQPKNKVAYKKTNYRSSYEWKIELTKKITPGKTYWAQDSKGRGKNQSVRNEVEFSISKFGLARSALVNGLLSAIAEGYVGARFGYPLSQGDPLISKTPLVGIFAHVRGGPLAGLRWNWDFAPKTKVEIDGTEFNMTWSRPSLGWSIGFELPFFFDRIDVVPRLSLMDFDGIIPIADIEDDLPDQSFFAKEFRIKNAPGIGLEIGLERSAGWFLMRLWGATDVSGLISGGNLSSVSSLRGGLDLYWELFKMGKSYQFTLLSFIFGENLGLKQKSDSDDFDEGNLSTLVILDGLSFNNAFAGFGLTLTW